MNDMVKRRRGTVKRAIRILVLSGVAMAVAQAGEWRVGVVEGAIGGKFSSLRIDKYGNAHVVSFYAQEWTAWYSFWDHSLNKWFSTPLENSSGFCSLTLDSKQRPHISYPEYGTGKLKHVYWDGSSWVKQTIPINTRIISYYTSITLDSQDRPSISFYEEGAVDVRKDLRLRVVTWNGKFWEVETVDGDEGSGKFSSIATDLAGHIHIAYGNVEYANASLRYAQWNGRSWQREILEGKGVPGTSMFSVSMMLDKQNVPHIAYTDVVKRLVKYATKVDGVWQMQVVEPLVAMGYPDRNGIALDDNGIPYISYYDSGRGVLKVAHLKDHHWVSEVVDQDFAGFNNSLQIDHGTIWVTYSDASGDRLKFARGSVEQAQSSSEKRPEVTRK